MDVLTDVLGSMRLTGELFCRTELTAPWGVEVPAIGGAAFHVLDRGNAWMVVEGEEHPISLTGGDLIIFTRSRRHVLVDSLEAVTVPLAELVKLKGEGNYTLNYGGGGSHTTLICGRFNIQDGGKHNLFASLPPILHVKGEQGRTIEWLETTLKFMAWEADSTLPGSQSIVAHLTEILFIQAIRSWISSQNDDAKGWLTALSDQQIGEALRCIHKNPEHPWTVESIGVKVGMSRASFAAKFRQLVGETPHQYLTSWRMQLASNWLTNSSLKLSEIAEKVGYFSEVSFKRAFKKNIGIPPGAFRRQARL